MDDKNATDIYTRNLTLVNQHNAVVSSENIYNRKGALVVAVGTEIRTEVAQRIASHKLSKPIEQSISLKESVNSERLVEHFTTMPSHPEVVEIYENKLSLTLLKNESKKIDAYPLLNQKLTVMWILYPELYKKTVFGAYLALLLCQELKLSEKTTHCVFVASLARDIGLLHIDPEVLQKSGTISNDEWKLLQGHVAISYHILKLVPGIPECVKRAVLEHHERADGFGYPLGRIDAELSREGQIVAFADMIIALFYKYIFGLGYSLQSLVPIIQVNAGIHRNDNTVAALRLFQKLVAPMRKKHASFEFPGVVKKLVAVHPLVDQLFSEIVDFNRQLNKSTIDQKVTRSTQMINALRSLFVTSGINDHALVVWFKILDFSIATEEECLEVEKFALMLNEGIYKIGEVLKNLVAQLQEMEAEDDDKLHYSAIFARFNRRFNTIRQTMTIIG